MMRAAPLLLTVGLCRGYGCHGQCSAPQDTSNLIQKHKTVADFEFTDDDDDDGWSFKNSLFDKLVDKLKPDRVEERIDQIIGDNGISLESAQKKLFGLANKFGHRLNRTIDAAQERLAALQDFVEKKGRQVKDQSLLQAVNLITQLGDSAVDVASKVTAAVETGQLKVRQFVRMLKSERVEARRREMQQSLNEATEVLMGLLQSLQDAMGIGGEKDLLLELNAAEVANATDDELTEVALKRAEALLEHTDAVLETAKVYVNFVETRVNAVRDEATELVQQAGNRTDAAFDLSNKLAEDVIKKLGDIDGMLSGRISVLDASKIMEKERSSARATSFVFVAVAVILQLQ